MKALHVVHVKTFDDKPLAQVDLPGLGVELTPAAMRDLARALTAAADECEARPMGKYYRRTVRDYPIGPSDGIKASDA